MDFEWVDRDRRAHGVASERPGSAKIEGDGALSQAAASVAAAEEAQSTPHHAQCCGAPAADIWGYCSWCQRWFACPTWFDRDRPAPTCPVCGAEPRAIENRAAHRS